MKLIKGMEQIEYYLQEIEQNCKFLRKHIIEIYKNQDAV